MRLTHLADYAVVIMTAAARREAGARLSASELAQETGVPLPTTQKLMGRLAAEGLLTSVRGAAGGFALARAADDDHPRRHRRGGRGPDRDDGLFADMRDPSDCALDAHCRVKPHMGVVGNAIRGALGAVSLTELAQ